MIPHRDPYEGLLNRLREDVVSAILRLPDDEALSRMFLNLRGRPPARAGLRLTSQGFQIVKRAFPHYEIPNLVLTNRSLLYLENEQKMPYYYSEAKRILYIFDGELAFHLTLHDGDIDSHMTNVGFMNPKIRRKIR